MPQTPRAVTTPKAGRPTETANPSKGKGPASAAASAQKAGATPASGPIPGWLREVRESAAQVVAATVALAKPPAGFASLAQASAAALAGRQLPPPPSGAPPSAPTTPVAEPSPVSSSGIPITAVDVERFHFPGEGARVVFVDGVLQPELGFAPENGALKLARGAQATSMAAMLRGNSERLEEHLNRYADPDDPFTALNALHFQDGLVLQLSAGTVLEAPVHVLWLHSGAPTMATGAGADAAPRVLPSADAAPVEPRHAVHARLLVLAGPNSQCTILEQHASLATRACATNSVVEVVADAGATVRHVKVQREGLRTDHHASFHARQAQDSNVESFILSVGGREVDHTVALNLAGTGSTGTTDGVFLAAGHQRVDCRTIVEHSVPHTTSHQVWKGILDGQSRGSFTGMVTVRPDAQKTNADQSNRNLLLSKDALVASTPQLEIHADDVKCSHGSTIGRLDDDALFFLRSRGLDPEAARLMLTQAFAKGALDRIHDEGIRGLVGGLVTGWFLGRLKLAEKGWPGVSP